MKTSSLPLFFLLLALVFPGAGHASADLYTGEVVVQQGRGADAENLRMALGQVLVKLTGQPELARDSGLLAAAGNPESLMLGYQFRDVRLPMRDGELLEERRLVAEFEPRMVDRLLEAQNLPRWGRERPEMLVWTAFETAEDGVAYGDTESEWLLPHLDDAAGRHGLSLLTPLYDGMDRALVSTEEIRGGFVDAPLQAISRYGADGVVMADFREWDGGWTVRVSWRLGREEDSLVLRGEEPEPLLAEGVAELSRFLADRFSVVRSADAGRRKLTVSGVRNPAQFAEVQGYLERLSVVDRVRLQSAVGDRLYFELELNASGLEDVLAIGDLLEPVDDRQAGDSLHYRLRW